MGNMATARLEPADDARREAGAAMHTETNIPVEIGLSVAIVSVQDDEPVVLTVKAAGDREPMAAVAPTMLPSGPFSPTEHRTLDVGLRSWVSEQTSVDLGYVEQLYTFGDRGRHRQPTDLDPHVVSIGYLALTQSPGRKSAPVQPTAAQWRAWYDFFPWEDWRRGKPAILTEVIEPQLKSWALDDANSDMSKSRLLDRTARTRMAFGFDGGSWDEERVLDRYELLYEAGMVDEARNDGRFSSEPERPELQLGVHMQHDHRRILATAISRMRGKIKYRPVVFELMPPEFTLFELQKTVEAILGPHLHKQNFRRLVESAGLVEPTNEVRAKTGGRPAKLYRFRHEVLLERPAPGVRVKPGRS